MISFVNILWTVIYCVFLQCVAVNTEEAFDGDTVFLPCTHTLNSSELAQIRWQNTKGGTTQTVLIYTPAGGVVGRNSWTDRVNCTIPEGTLEIRDVNATVDDAPFRCTAYSSVTGVHGPYTVELYVCDTKEGDPILYDTNYNGPHDKIPSDFELVITASMYVCKNVSESVTWKANSISIPATAHTTSWNSSTRMATSILRVTKDILPLGSTGYKFSCEMVVVLAGGNSKTWTNLPGFAPFGRKSSSQSTRATMGITMAVVAAARIIVGIY